MAPIWLLLLPSVLVKTSPRPATPSGKAALLLFLA